MNGNKDIIVSTISESVKKKWENEDKEFEKEMKSIKEEIAPQQRDSKKIDL